MEQTLLYVCIAAAAAMVTLPFLLLTKVPALVTTGSALLVGVLVVIVARVDLGYWDPLAPIAFVANTAFAFGISFALLAIGRWLRWPFFLSRGSRSQATSD